MKRRRSRRRYVKGKPNLIWIASGGSLALVTANTEHDALLIPADWSGTVTEQSATLLRMVVCCYTYTIGGVGSLHAENACIYMSDANLTTAGDVNDISNVTEFPDWCENHDRQLHWFRLEWSDQARQNTELPVQYSQLPDPVMNLRTPRLLRPDDTVDIGVGCKFVIDQETPCVDWFCRSLVRIGMR